MPYQVKKMGEKYCVCKRESGKPVKGGCHPEKSKAMDHMTAIIMNEHKPKSKGMM